MEQAAASESKPPHIVRIKRKRDEPALPGFLLGAKRRPTSLSSLAIGSDSQPAQPATRYKFVGTVQTQGGGLFVPTPQQLPPKSSEQQPSDSAQAAAGRALAHQQSARAQQAQARYRTVSLRRSSSSDGGAAQHVLELQRVAGVPKCASVPSLPAVAASTTAPPPAPKLRPFGPPLPPQPHCAPAVAKVRNGGGGSSHASVSMADAVVDLDSIWRDAAMAAELGESSMHSSVVSTDANPAVSPGHQDADDFVYDEYSLAAEDDGDESGSAAAADVADDGAWDELWWEELDANAVRELEEIDDAAGSDSQGEMDYPDENSDGVLSEGDD